MKSIILAIILAESGFDPSAYNKEGRAAGLGQITAIAVKEAHNVCGLSLTPDLFDPSVNLKYTICIYNHYRKTSRSDIEAIITYHSGYVGRRRFRYGKSPGPKTSKYAMRVMHFKDMFETKRLDTERVCKKYKLPKELCNDK